MAVKGGEEREENVEFFFAKAENLADYEIEQENMLPMVTNSMVIYMESE